MRMSIGITEMYHIPEVKTRTLQVLSEKSVE